MIVSETVCDKCGRQKRKSNNWYRAQVTNYGFHFYTHEADPTDDDLLDLCSDACAMRAFAEFIDKARMIPPNIKEELRCDECGCGMGAHLELCTKG